MNIYAVLNTMNKASTECRSAIAHIPTASTAILHQTYDGGVQTVDKVLNDIISMNEGIELITEHFIDETRTHHITNIQWTRTIA